MYDLIDRPVAHLNPSGVVMLRAMRYWVRQAAAGRCGCTELQALFAAHGFRRSIGPFRTFMVALHTGARRNVRFHHPDCPRIGEDEAILLAMVRRQAGGSAARLDVASSFVIGARLPQFLHGLDHLSKSFGEHDAGPCIPAERRANGFSGDKP